VAAEEAAVVVEEEEVLVDLGLLLHLLLPLVRLTQLPLAVVELPV
jgi:hypothetical protein